MTNFWRPRYSYILQYIFAKFELFKIVFFDFLIEFFIRNKKDKEWFEMVRRSIHTTSPRAFQRSPDDVTQ